jgi:hypothetical protein
MSLSLADGYFLLGQAVQVKHGLGLGWSWLGSGTSLSSGPLTPEKGYQDAGQAGDCQNDADPGKYPGS